MYPAKLIKKEQEFKAGEIIFGQDTPALFFVGLQEGEAELLFDEYPISQSIPGKGVFARISAPFPLSGGAALRPNQTQNFALRCLSETALVIFWEFNDDFECPEQEKFQFLSTVSSSVSVLTNLLAQTLRLRSLIDSTMRLYKSDLLEIFNSLQQHIKRWSSIELGAYHYLHKAISNFKSNLPCPAEKKIESILNTNKFERIIKSSLPKSPQNNFTLPAGYRLSLSEGDRGLLLLIRGEIEACVGAIGLQRYQEDSFIGMQSLFDPDIIEYKAISDCRIRVICHSQQQLQKLIATPTPLARLLTESVIGDFLEISLYLAFISGEVTRELTLIKGNNNSFYSVTEKLCSDIAAFPELSEYRKKLEEYTQSISSLYDNCLTIFNDNKLKI